MIKDKHQRVHTEFIQTMDELFPDIRSMTEKTKKLNERLQDLIGEVDGKKTLQKIK